MSQRIALLLVSVALLSSINSGCATNSPPPIYVPTSYPDEPACKVKSVQKAPTEYENVVVSPTEDLMAFTQLDSDEVYQVYVKKTGDKGTGKCISCSELPGHPRLDRNKPMLTWHPSGDWLIVGIEENEHDNTWMPNSWQRGFLQSGIWLNLWITNPTGDKWHQVTDFKPTRENPSNGYVGTAFTPDGRKGVWAEIVDGNIFVNSFGIWKLFIADFVVSPDGTPSFINKKEITPAGARWIEPGNFAADGRHMLISSDIGLDDAQGQDQYLLDVVTGKVVNLTKTPEVWDEHGLFSLDNRKVSFMSSYPFKNDPRSHKTFSLKTEIMLMDLDGGHLQQITHFNSPGYPESLGKQAVAAVGGFIGDGSQMFVMVMSTDFKFGKTNWIVTFDGPCGNQSRDGLSRF